MDKYIIFAPKGRGRFANRLGELYLTIGDYIDMEKTEGRHLQFCKVFLSDAQNQYEELTQSPLYAEIISTAANSIIEQPPLDGSKITIMVKTTDDADNFILHSIRLTEGYGHHDERAMC